MPNIETKKMEALTKNIPIASPCFNGNEKHYLMECIDSTRLSSEGKFVAEFEKQFAEFCDAKHALACSNGTVAIHLALLAHDLKPGDEVIVPTFTYIASANAVMYCGAKPVFVDSEPDTWNIDPAKIEEAITEKTKGIIAVHIYGHPADMAPIMEIAKKHNLFVVEDAAEAHGALYNGQKVGSIGHSSTFSFFGNKIITCGEGGAVVTNDSHIASKAKLLKGQGMDPNRRYWFPIIGYNYRMTNMQGAVALAQLENIEWHQAQRQQVAQWYDKHLQELTDHIVLPVEKSYAHHAYWMYSILLKKGGEAERDELMKRLAKEGVETRPLFYPLHIMPPYEQLHKDTAAQLTATTKGKSYDATFPVATSFAARGMNLPTHANMDEDDVQYIAALIKENIKNLRA
jgi:perosamine synthetase